MQVPTNISNVLEGNANKSKYDAEVKKVLSNKQILAWILKYSVQELMEYSLEIIQECIEGVPEVGTHMVRPGHYSEVIDGMNTEDTVPGEGKITYDIRFRVILPDGSKRGMIINVEAQKSFHTTYDLVTRGVFYCSRMLSSQLDNYFSGKDYDSIQKVYSIWICLNAPKKAEYTITRYAIRREDVYKHADIDTRYDLMEVIMVYLGDENRSVEGTKMHGLLSTVLSETLEVKEKKRILEQEYNLKTTAELEGGLVSMCNLSDAIEEKGKAEALWNTARKLRKNPALSAEYIAETLGLPVEEVAKLPEN